ncbi:MAG: hypothetical protein ACREFE_15330, partial [Limisphaerales bacterium]
MKNMLNFFGIMQFIILCFVAIGASAQSNTNLSPWISIGGKNFTGWKNLEPSSNDSAIWKLSDEAVFQYPQGPRGWYFVGFRQENDSTRDWRNFYGLQLEVLVPRNRTVKLQATIATPPEEPRQEYVSASHAKCSVIGNGKWEQMTLPWTEFDYNKS